MNLFVFGWNCQAELTNRALEQLLSVGDLYPQIDSATSWSWTGGEGVFAGSVHTPQDALGTRRYVEHDDYGVAFFDGTAVDTRNEIAPQNAGDLRRAWDGLAERLEGQYVAVRIEKSPARVDILNDFLGMRQVYYRRIDRGYVFSNSVELLARLDESCELDPLGVSSFLCFGHASGDRTLLRDIRVLPPGQQWTWKASDGAEPSHETHYSPSRLARLSRGRLTRDDIDRLADRLARVVTGLTNQYDEVSCGLTGGRDSRLLAAILTGRQVPVRFATYGPGESRDAQLARRIAAALRVRHEVQSGEGDEIAAEWDQISKALVCQNDGLVSLWQVAVMLNRESRVERLDVFLAGHGGEISRGVYLGPQHLVLPSSRRGIRRFMLARLFGSDAGLATVDARGEARAFVERLVNQELDQGYEPNSVPDAFFTYDRTRRWAGTVGVRPSLPVGDVFEPFCTRPFVELAFSMQLRDRYTEALHLRAIPQLAPALTGIPFDKSDNQAVRVAKDLARSVARRDPFGLIERKRWRSESGVQWVQTLVPRLRAECLEQANSPLWDFVDRGAFERVTDERSVSASSPAEAVLRVVTLFYYWRERQSVRTGAETCGSSP
jgi:asparagine synthase (glutamine-hydrolysing)